MLSERVAGYARGLGLTPAGEPDPPWGQASASGWTKLPNGTWFRAAGVSKGLPSKKGAPYSQPEYSYTSPTTGLTIYGFRRIGITQERNFDPQTGKPEEFPTGGYVVPSWWFEKEKKVGPWESTAQTTPASMPMLSSRASRYTVDVLRAQAAGPLQSEPTTTGAPPRPQLPYLPPRASNAPPPPTATDASSGFELRATMKPSGRPSGSLLPSVARPWWADRPPAWWGGALRGVGAVQPSALPPPVPPVSRALRYAAEVALRRTGGPL